MSGSAQVTSIDALRRFRSELIRYVETLQSCLDSLKSESNRGLDWVESDRLSYWPAQVRMAGEALVEAQNRLQAKQVTIRPEDRPPCTEEKKAVQLAKQRKAFTERQYANTRRWLPVVRHETEEFRGMLGKIANMVDCDLPKAIAVLQKMIEALDKYAESSVQSKSSTSE